MKTQTTVANINDPTASMKSFSSLFAWLAVFLSLGAGVLSAETSYRNPLVKQRADPFVLRHTDGYYYLAATVPEYDRLELRRSKSIQTLGEAEPLVIWRAHAKGEMGAHIWAPELHRIEGKWYIYFAAGRAKPESVWAIRMYVLENVADNPLDGEWVEKGEIKTDWESFALDATTFEHAGKRYLLWAQADPKMGRGTNLYIAEMDTPWSIRSPQVMLSKPDREWEKKRFPVNEGPAVLTRNGRVFVAYSASGTDANYCMGLLTASADSNLLEPKSWAKSPEPVFRTSQANGQFGPGHNSFTVSEDGQEDVMVYHARDYEEIVGDPLKDPNRHTRAQVLKWKPDGTPDFGEPVPDAK